MADAQKTEEINYVHQQTIQSETVAKELRYQKLFTKFGINPFKKQHFLKVINRAALEPKKVHEEPQTVNQEYGWIPVPLVSWRSHVLSINYGIYHTHCYFVGDFTFDF
ncbi:unnamed protein product [Schistocephalus solidus]|uniref:HTH araC/xylS-type domain-containing protein n=1 Tax=Schistocephalus solidus TaxID=70667 RepID=A0A183S992_SCHSO|nr:unnamed protein product [Schistocephalus solidus]